MKQYFKIAIILRTLLFVGICVAVFVMLDTQNQLENRKISERLSLAFDLKINDKVPSSRPQKQYTIQRYSSESCSEIKYVVQIQNDIINDLRSKSESTTTKVMWLIVATFISTIGLGISKLTEMGFAKIFTGRKKRS